jgi:hypothetical protein
MDRLNIVLLLILLVSVVLLMFRTSYIPRGGVIFIVKVGLRSIDFNDTILKIYTIKTHIFEGLTRFCGDKYSHWSVFVKTASGNNYILSSSRYHNVYIYKINDSQLTVKGIRKGLNPRYVWGKNKHGYDCKHSCTLGELIDYVRGVVAAVTYSSFGSNCHYIVKSVLHMYCGKAFPSLDVMESFSEIFSDRLLGKDIFS